MKSKLLFGDCAELRSEKVDPKSSQESYYIGLEHIEQQSLCLAGHGFGSDVDSQKQRFYKGDILFGKLRPYFRKVVVAPFDGICSTDIWVVKPKAGIARNFLFYWIASEEFIVSSTHASEGGRMPRAKWDWVSRFELKNFTPKEQSVIGAILGALDQKIAANRELCKTLEEMAQKIFKSWFIDFDPVKAKMAGEKPEGMDAATASLFPDSMEESELGLIPRDWEIAPIGSVLDVRGGTTPSTTNAAFWNGDYCWITPKDLSRQAGIISTNSERKITDLGLAQISSGLLPINSVLMSCRAPIGYVSINAVQTAVNQGFITLRHSEEFHPLYVLNWINANMQEIHNRAGGATFAEITRKAFREIPFIKPSANLLNKYSELAEPLLQQIEQLTRQTENLQAIKDSLLPRLISGELQIPEEMLAL